MNPLVRPALLGFSSLALASFACSSTDPGADGEDDVSSSGGTTADAATGGQSPADGTGGRNDEEPWVPDGRLSGNPIFHSIYSADPSAHVYQGRLYVYASRDMDPNEGCDLMDRPHVYSTSNMVDWVDEGETINSGELSWGRQRLGYEALTVGKDNPQLQPGLGGFLWAPDAAEKDGTYYYYFPHPSELDWGGSWKIGVATSQEPASGFAPKGYIEGLPPLIDPAVFVDDDGQAYLYIGGGGVPKGGKLASNMTSLDGSLVDMTGLVDFHEATWVHRKGDTYYLSYADNHEDGKDEVPGDNRLRYATSSSPLGPWTYQGILLDPTDSYCSHGSIVTFQGHDFLFYFTSELSGNDWLRSVRVDVLTYNPDGTIQKVVQTTSGVESVGPAESQPEMATYEAEAATLTTAIAEVHTSASGGQAVGSLHLVGSTVLLENVDGGAGGRVTIHLDYAANEMSKLELVVNGVSQSFINTPSTASWDDYSGHSYETVELLAGATNTIELRGGHGGVNLDRIRTTGF